MDTWWWGCEPPNPPPPLQRLRTYTLCLGVTQHTTTTVPLRCVCPSGAQSHAEPRNLCAQPQPFSFRRWAGGEQCPPLPA